MTGSPDPAPILPEVAEEIRGRVRVGSVAAEPVAIAPAGEPLLAEMESLRAALAERHHGMKPGEIPELAPARRLYREFGIDPTRTRPSSEALLRRILKDKPLPRILNAVDACTLCSLKFLLPLGLYDAGKLDGQVRLRLGDPGESYQGIRKDDVHLEGRLTLADAEGPFGNPTSDSLRTSVTAATRSLWMVIFAPASCPPGEMEEHVLSAREILARHLAPPGETVRHSGAVL